MCLRLSKHVFAYLMAVFNQLAHNCGHLTDSALKLQGSVILIYEGFQCMQVYLVFCKSLCVLFCKKCEADIVLIVVHIGANLLLLECHCLIIVWY